MELQQVKLKLTTNPDILTALRHVGALKQTKEGEEYMAIQHDAMEYRFFHGVDMVFPANVAESLYRQSGVLIGDAISGTQQPGLLVVEKWELGQQEPSRKASKTVCSVCGEDQKSVKALAAHMASHVEDEEEEEEEEK